LESRVAHQRTGQQARFAENLEAVADAQNGATGARVRRDSAQYRREARDRPGTQVVPIAEAAGEDHRIRLFEIGVAVPDEIRVRSGGARRVERVGVAIRAREDDYCDTLHS